MMRKVLVCEKTGLKKGSWTPEEDTLLSNYIKRYGHWNWGELPKYAGLQRCGKSCRLRWMNYLRPDIKRGKYSKEEEDLIIRLHREFGNKWSKIASSLPGRTDNEIKNHWHSHLKKRSEGKVKAKSKAVEREKPLVPICFFPNAPTPVILESSAVVSPPPLKPCYDDDDGDDISTVTVELKL